MIHRMSAKKAKTMGEASEITGENVVEIQKHSSGKERVFS